MTTLFVHTLYIFQQIQQSVDIASVSEHSNSATWTWVMSVETARIQFFAVLFPEQRQHMTNRLKPSIPWCITKRHLIVLWLPLARYFPQVIRTRHKISTSICGWSLSHGKRRTSLMNRSSDSVALNINSPCDQMGLYHYLPTIWMVTFNRGNHLLKPIFCNICVLRAVKIILFYCIINNWSGNL